MSVPEMQYQQLLMVSKPDMLNLNCWLFLYKKTFLADMHHKSTLKLEMEMCKYAEPSGLIS